MKMIQASLFFVLAAGFVEAQTPALNLKQTVDFALNKSPLFQNAKKAQTINELQYKSAYARLYPSLDFTTQDGIQNNTPLSSDNSTVFTTNPTAPWYSTLSLGLTENLYDNGVSLTNIDIADLNREIANVSYKKAKDSLTLDISTEFYHYSLLTALLDVRKVQQTILAKQFRTLTSQYYQGFKPKSDFLRLKIQVQQAEIDRISAENDIKQSEANLRKLIGVDATDVSSPRFLPLTVSKEAIQEENFPTRAPDVSEFYDARLARLQDRVNQKNVLLVEKLYWPQIALTSGVTYSNQNYINSASSFSSGNQLTWTALVTLTYNFWDWGIKRRDWEVARINRDIQLNTLNQNLLSVNAGIQSLMALLAKTGKSYALNRELLNLQDESNRELEIQYRAGKVTYLDLITSLNLLLSARIQFYTSYFDALTGFAQYKYYQGKLYDSLADE